MSVDKLKSLLRKYNLKPNFTYGQNFLIDEEVLEDIVKAADISPSDQILEIGPGVGNLTRKLCKSAGLVLAVEKDEKFLPILKSIKRDYSNKFKYEIADVLEFDFQKFFVQQSAVKNLQSYKVVANIPYFITGKILETLLTARHKPTSITLLTQKEVAERVCAKAGDLSVLAISVQIFGKPKIVRLVSKNSFHPAPKVDSALLRIDLSPRPEYSFGDEKKFFRIVKACFAGKRKQLHNTLVNNLKLPKEKVLQVLQELNLDPKTRPQELTIEEWIELSEKIFNS